MDIPTVERSTPRAGPRPAARSGARAGIAGRLWSAWWRMPLLWRMVVVAAAIHGLLFTAVGVARLLPERETPEQHYQRAEAAMSKGKYAEARDLFQGVLDMQPKPLPVFARAAEQHRAAERLAQQQQAAGPEPAVPAAAPKTDPAGAPPARAEEPPARQTLKAAPTTGPARRPGDGSDSPSDIIPPELK